MTSMITDRIGRHKIFLPINHKNCNFREKKNSQVMKEGEIKFTLKKIDKGNINILRSPRLLQVIMRQKLKTALAHARYKLQLVIG